jgi:N-acetylmuramoyl-L-alanine amidase
VVLAIAALAVWAALPSARHALADHLVPGASSGATALDPSYFATGSCVAYPPTNGNRHTTVFLDAGHGGIDPGALGTTESGQTITEASLTLPVELDSMALLRADGYRVVVSRTTDNTVLRLGPKDTSGSELTLTGAHDDVAARDVCANDAGAAVLVGIYLDSGGSPSNAGTLAAYDTARPFAAQNEKLATLVEDDVLASLNAPGWQIPDDGTVPDSQVGSLSGDPYESGLAAQAAGYGHLLLLGPAETGFFTTPSNMPGTVVEPLFITDPFEGTIADSTAGQQAVARGVAQAVEQFLAPPQGDGAKSATAAS